MTTRTSTTSSTRRSKLWQTCVTELSYKETADAILAAGGVDAASCDAFSRMINSSEMKDIFLAMFGDHVKVTATREGFDVEDYDHD